MMIQTLPLDPVCGFSVLTPKILRRKHQCTGSAVAHMVLTKINKALVGVKEIIQDQVSVNLSLFDFCSACYFSSAASQG